MVVVAMLLGFMGYILVLNLIQVLKIPLDYVTMCFALWNFSVTGLISVFWKGPMWLQQVYLTFMSSLMVSGCIVDQSIARPLNQHALDGHSHERFLWIIGILANRTRRVDNMDAASIAGCVGYDSLYSKKVFLGS